MSDEPFGDIPLFREIQKLLSTGSGPINLEIALQVASTLASEGARTEADATVGAVLRAGVTEAEVVVAGYTRIPLTEPVRPELLGRAAWPRRSAEGWKWLLEQLAAHLAAELQRGAPEQPPESGVAGVEAVLGQVAPLLFGIQAGTLLGHLARESLGRYEPLLPRDDDLRLFFVGQNVREVADEYGLDLDTFARWVAADQVARHHLVVNVVWVNRYHKSLIGALIDAVEIDSADIERRLMDLRSGGLEGLEDGLNAHELLPVVATERHGTALKSVAAFAAIVDGYATHARRAVGEELLGDTTGIEEAMARRAASPGEGEKLLYGLLGLAPDRSLHAMAATFCAAIVKLRGIEALNRVWDAPDNLPSFEEIRDPFAWSERVLGE